MIDKPKKKKPFLSTNTWFTIMGYVLMIFFAFTAGLGFGTGEIANGVLNLILMVFWIGFVGIMHAQRVLDIEFDSAVRELEVMSKFAKDLEILVEKAEAEKNESLEDIAEGTHKKLLKKVLMKIMNDVMGTSEGTPTQEQCDEVTRRFEKLTGHPVVLTVDENGIDVEIDIDKHGLLDKKDSAQTELPLDKTPTTNIPVKGTSKGTKVPVRKKSIKKK